MASFTSLGKQFHVVQWISKTGERGTSHAAEAASWKEGNHHRLVGMQGLWIGLFDLYYDGVCAVRIICSNILTGHLLLKGHVNVTQGP